MKDQPASGDGPFQRFPIAQISGYFLDFQFTNFTSRPDQGAHSMATRQQFSSDMPANETGRAGNQRRFHNRSYFTPVTPAIFVGQVGNLPNKLFLKHVGNGFIETPKSST